MQALMQFLHFDCMKFFTAKTLSVVSVSPLSDYNTKEIIGSKVTVAITRDETEYKAKADGTIPSNLFEKLAVKVPGKTLSLATGSVVELVNPTAVVYGDYRDKLSVTAEDVKAIAPAPTGKA